MPIPVRGRRIAHARASAKTSPRMPKEHLDGTIFGEGQPCFGCAPDHPFGFRLRFERDGQRVRTRFTPGALHQGPPGIMHGGLVTALADEVAAWVPIAVCGKFGFTASLSGKLHKPLRVGKEIVAEAVVDKDTPRLVDVSVSLSQEEGLAFSGSFRFVVMDRAGAERMLGRALPPEWERFSR